ncbi:hypothetical protein [uncultured Ferrimonas sp.]|uniref:hypothetical protein n=1 Tax=uncultured Ferrimonas sp. TaxID=432640 RepID=UPI00261B7B83|nr:hypothetical protein [uncultured Ferrimonas sp.]
MRRRYHHLAPLWAVALLLNVGCASTGSSSAPTGTTLGQPLVLQWQADQSAAWLLGQHLTPQLLASARLAIAVGPSNQQQPLWQRALVGQQRQRQLETGLRQLGYQGQIDCRYQPALAADQITVGLTHAQ